MRARTACGALLLVTAAAMSAGAQAPVIDMHVHALRVAEFGPGAAVCSDSRGIEWNGWDPRTPFSLAEAGTCGAASWPAPPDDTALLRGTLAAFERYHIRAVTFGPPEEVARWRAAAPARIIPAVSFFDGDDSLGRPRLRDLGELRRMVADGRVAVFAENGPQYHGMRPGDPALEPYFALAEELDVPVGLHMGEGPPGGRHVEGYERYRVELGNPLLLEEVLAKHPRLRLYVMHYGSPFVDEMIAILYSYPQVYVDVSQNDWGFPRAHFYSQLRRLVQAGFGRRILFGSDQMIWPETIGLAIRTITEADFLTAVQKRDILYNNAVRFLRLQARDQDGATIVGRWHGESICVKAAWNSACNDERVVYDFVADSAPPGRVRLRASKLVGGRPESMGDLDLAYRPADSTWFGDFSNSRVRIRWEYRVRGDSLSGRVIDRASGRVARAVRAARGE